MTPDKDVNIKLSVDTSDVDKAKKKVDDLAHSVGAIPKGTAGGGPGGPAGGPPSPGSSASSQDLYNRIRQRISAEGGAPGPGGAPAPGGGPVNVGWNPTVPWGSPAGGPAPGGGFMGQGGILGLGLPSSVWAAGGMAVTAGALAKGAGWVQNNFGDIDRDRNANRTWMRKGWDALSTVTGGIADDVWNFADISPMGSNRANRLREVERMSGRLGAMHQAGTQEMGIRLGEYGQTFGLRSQQGEAAAQAQAAREYANQLRDQPGLAASFITSESLMGVQNRGTGAARQAVAEAQAGVRAAQLELDAQQKLAGEAKGRIGSAKDAYAQAQANAANAAAEYQKAAGDPSKGGRVSEAEAAQRGEAMQTAVSNAGARVEQAQKDAQATITAEKEKQEKLDRAKLQLAQAELGVARNRVELLRQQEQAGRQGSAQLATMNPAERQGLMIAAEKLKGGKWDELSPLEKEMLGGNAFTSEAYQKEAERRGADTEEGKKLGQMFNVGDWRDKKKEADDAESDIAKRQAEITAQGAEKYAEVQKKFLDELMKLFAEINTQAIANLRNEATRGNYQRQAQQAAAQAQK